MKCVNKIIFAIALSLLLISCPKVTDTIKDPIPTGFARIKGKLTLPGGATGSTSGAEVYILGQRQYKATTDANGEYSLLVDARMDGVTAKSMHLSRAGIDDLNNLGFQLIGLTQDNDYGSKIDNVTVAIGTEDLLPPITIEKTGTISGKILLEGGADPTGIDVYIPGTSSIAKTAADGSFVISKVPTGTYLYLRAEKTGYLPKYWTNIKVLPDTTSAFDQATLSVSTGVAGAISIANGAEFSRTRTVDVSITYSPDALLMQVSEDPTFIGAQWKFVQDKITHTFNSDGNKTIYINFTDSNGLETKVSDNIIIVADPQPSDLSPNAITGETKPNFRWAPSLLPSETYDFQLATDPGFTKIIEEHNKFATASVKAESALSNKVTYYWRVRSVDNQNIFGVWISANFSVDLSIPRPSQPGHETVIDQSKPTLSWDSDADNARFIVQIAETSDFSALLETKSGLTSKQYIPGITLKTDTTYYWRVAVEGEGNIHGEWGGPSMFHMVLPALETSTPGPGSSLANRCPLFSWNSAQRAKNYRIQIALNESFSSISIDQGGLATNSYKPTEPGLKGNATYFWRVAYVDSNSCQSTWSETKEFSILPYTLSSFQPAGAIQNSQPTFSWGKSYLLNQTFWFEIADNNEFSVILESKKGIVTPSYKMAKTIENSKQYYWRVKAIASDGDEGPWSNTQEIRLDYSGIILTQPQNESVLRSRTPEFKWEAHSKAASYRLQIDEDIQFGSPDLVKTGIGTINYVSEAALKGGNSYYWRVSYVDEAGVQGPWSSPRSFSIDTYLVDGVSPEGNPGTSKPLFKWSDSYLAGESYWVQVADNNEFTAPLIDKKGLATTSYLAENAIEHGKNYYWRVKAVASDGDEGPWSGTKVINLQYPAVTLTKPTTGSELASRTPTFEWLAGGAAAKYNVQVSEETTFVTMVMNAEVAGGAILQSKVNLQGGKSYYWRVRYADVNGIYGPWSECLGFKVKPYEVTGTKPIGNPGMSKPTYEWSDSYLSGESYWLQVGTSASFATLVVDEKGIVGTSYQATAILEHGKSYYWRVKAVASDGNEGPWSTVQEIKLAYSAPVLSVPEKDAEITTREPEFKWGKETSAAKYQIQVSEDTTFGLPIVNADVASGETYRSTVGLKGGKNYYWRVRYADVNGIYGPWSVSWGFTIKKYEVQALAPKGMLEASRPVYEWTDSYLANETYSLQVSKDQSFTVLAVNDKGITTTSYKAMSALENLTTYYWRVKAIASDGDEGPWSEVEEIKLNYSGMVMLEPSADAEFSTRTPEFKWEAHSKAASYRLQIDEDIQFGSPDLDKTGIGTINCVSEAALKGGKSYYWRVSYVDEAGVQGPWSEKRKFSIKSYIVNGETPEGNPGTSKPLFKWSDSYLAGESYWVQVADNNEFTAPLIDKKGLATTSYLAENAIEHGKNYYWRVKAVASDGDEGPWSASKSITLLYTPPSISIPENASCIASRNPKLVWSSNPSASSYLVQIDKDTTFSHPVYESNVANLTSVTVSTPLAGGVTYYWRVAFIDANEIKSNWSDPWTFSIAIYQVTPVGPIGNPGTSKPKFEWTRSFLLDETYQFQLSKDSSFTEMLIDVDRIGLPEYRIGTALELSKTYYWRVRAKAPDGDVGPWCTINTISYYYSPVVLSLPSEASTIGTRVPEFSWETNNSASTYSIQIDDDLMFTSPIVNADGLKSPLFKPDISLNGGYSYYWRVRFVDDSGIFSPWSEKRQFQIQAYSVLLDTPDGNPGTSKPLFKWSDSYLANESFSFQLSESLQFEKLTINKTGLATNSYLAETAIEYGKAYYWRVKAIASDGDEGSWSIAKAITLQYPIASLSVPEHSIQLNERTPEFKWVGTTVAKKYQIQASEDTTFSTNMIDTEVVGTVFRSTCAFTGGKNYYWRVRYSDENGIWGSWTEAWRFSIAPYTISGLAPEGNPGTSKPTYEWTDCYLEGETYWLQVSASPTFSTMLVDDKGINGVSYIANGAIDNQKTYYWRVKAVASDGDEGPWSAIKQVKLEYPTPTLALPSWDTNFTSRTPEFSWEASDKAYVYRLQIDNDILFNSTEFDKADIGTNSYKITTALQGGYDYYWRIQFIDANGIAGPWSEKRKFYVQPYTVSVIGPFGNPGTSRPLFSWNASYLANQTYTLQIASDDRFENIVLEEPNIAKSSYRIEKSIANRTTYYWRVKAVASDGDEGPWSSLGSINLEYYGAALSSPWNGETVYSATPAFKWDAVPWASKYRILVGKSNTFTSPLVDEIIASTEYKPTSILPDNCSLYWKVQAIDEFDAGGDWSETRSIWLPPHALNMGINIKLPQSTISARMAGDGTYYMQVGGSVDVRVDNSWDFTSFEWALDGVPIKDGNGNKVISSSCTVSNLAKGRYSLSLIAIRSGVPYDTQATVIVQ